MDKRTLTNSKGPELVNEIENKQLSIHRPSINSQFVRRKQDELAMMNEIVTAIYTTDCVDDILTYPVQRLANYYKEFRFEMIFNNDAESLEAACTKEYDEKDNELIKPVSYQIQYGNTQVATIIVKPNASSNWQETDFEIFSEVMTHINVALNKMYQKNSIEQKYNAIKDTINEMNIVCEVSHFGVWRYDLQSGTLTMSSLANSSKFGFSIETGKTKTLQDIEEIIHPEDRPIIRQALINALHDEKKYFSFEHRIIDNDKQVLWALSNATVVKDEENGLPKKIIGITTDISEKKFNEFELKKTKSQFKALLDNIPLAAWLKDNDGRYVAVNKKFAEAFHKRFRYIIGKTDFDLFPPKMAAITHEKDLTVIKSKKSLKTDEVLHPSRNERYHEVYRTPVFDDKGNVLGVAGLSNDITDRIISKLQMSEQQRFLKSLIDTIPDLIYYKDSTGAFLGCNDSFAKLFLGLDEKDIIGKVYDEVLFENKDMAEMNIVENKVFRSGETQKIERKLSLTDGRKVSYEILITPFTGNEGNVLGIIGVARDVTERRETEVVLKKAIEAAEASNLLKSQFLANVSHEIRTPMNGIIGFLNLLDQSELTYKQREFVNRAKVSSDVMLYVINQILDFSKIEAGKLTLQKVKFNLQSLIEDSIAMIVHKAMEKNIELKINFDSSLPNDLVGDATRLRQVLNNLLTNAIKFTDQGEISVSVLLLKANADFAELKFEVRDTGIGIKQKDIEKLFQPFTQVYGSATRIYGGTGLGLAICHEIVQMMEGKIGVKSTVGKGSIFYFTAKFNISSTKLYDLMLVESEPKVENIAVTITEDDTLIEKAKQPNILLVEDNEINREIVQEVLTQMGLECDLAADGREALEKYHNKQYDIVLMDCQMPVMDGFECTGKIRDYEKKLSHRAIIIAMTANAMESDRLKCLASGMDDYISKPFDFDTFINMIEKYSKPISA